MWEVTVIDNKIMGAITWNFGVTSISTKGESIVNVELY